MLNYPDTVARSFSKLKLIKTFNRSHMTDRRQPSLAMLSIEASCVRSLDLDDVIKPLARQKTSSKLFWHYCIVTSDYRHWCDRSTSVSVCFRGISRLPSASAFLRWFKLAHISIQVCTFHDGCKQGIYQQIFNRKSISRKIMHPQSLFK